MRIIETTKYKKDETRKLENIKNLIISKNNFYEVLCDEYKKVYRIEKKSGNLKEYYTAHLNSKIRLIMKPIVVNIDDTHYGEG